MVLFAWGDQIKLFHYKYKFPSSVFKYKKKKIILWLYASAYQLLFLSCGAE